MAISIQELIEGQRRLSEKDTVPLRVSKKDLAGVLEQSTQATPTPGPLSKLAPPKQRPLDDAAEEQVPFMKLVYENAMNNIRSALGIPSEGTDTGGGREPEASNQQIIEEFSRLILQQQDLLLDATKEQIEIFKKLEESIVKLKDLGDENSKELRKSIDDLTNQLKQTPKTQAREQMQKATRAKPTTDISPSETQTKIKYKTPEARVAPLQAPALMPLPTAEKTTRATVQQSAGTLIPAPTLATDLYSDAGTLSSESEGDKVQTGEREMDMASILGFLGNMFSGDSGSGMGLPGFPSRQTPGSPTKGSPKRTGPFKDSRGDWKNAKGQYMPKSAQPKPGWWDKFKNMGKSMASPKTLLKGGILGTILLEGLSPTELGNGELGPEERKKLMESAQTPNANLVDLQTRHEQIQAEMYELIQQPRSEAVDARIQALNKEAAENMRLQNQTRTTSPVPATTPNSQVLDNSMRNKDLADSRNQQMQAPVIINNTQNTVAGNNQPQFIAPSPEVRPREDALNRYIFRGTKY